MNARIILNHCLHWLTFLCWAGKFWLVFTHSKIFQVMSRCAEIAMQKKLRIQGSSPGMFHWIIGFTCFFIYGLLFKVHDNPEVFIFHQLLTDDKINMLKQIATPRMKVAKVVDVHTNQLDTAGYRVSKSMFLLPDVPEDMDTNDRFHPLFEAVTGLSMKHAETLQINNYGLGGQYELHHDYGEVYIFHFLILNAWQHSSELKIVGTHPASFRCRGSWYFWNA